MKNDEASETSIDNSEKDWKPLTVFLEDDIYNDVAEIFVSRLKIEYDEVCRMEKRVVQEAIVKTAMGHSSEVIDRARELNEEIEESGGTDEIDWEAYNLYLTDPVHETFNEEFFMILKLEHSDLRKLMKRILHQASLEVGMEYPDEVVSYTMENPSNDSDYIDVS